MGEHTPDLIDANLERILNAAGSSLRHYMPSSKEQLRKVMGEIAAEDRATIEALVDALEKIACFDDKAASEILNTTGSYAAFDEPGSVEIARSALLLARGSAGNE